MKKCIRISLLVFIVLIVALVIGSFLVDEPLRRYAEQKANESLPGFDVSIKRLSTHPFTLSVTLDEVHVRQHRHPDPPLAAVREVRGLLRFLDLLSGRIALAARVQEPKIVINLERLKPFLDQLKEKAAPPPQIPWQDAIASLPAFTVAEIRILNGEASYVAGENMEQFTVNKIDFVIRNVRNRRLPDDPAFPSEISMESAVLGSGRLRVTGEADVLRKPVPALHADIDLQEFELAALKPIAQRYHVFIGKGFVTTTAVFDLSGEGAVFLIKEALVKEPVVEFVYTGPSAKEKAKVVKEKTGEKAKEVANKPRLLVKANRLRITGGDFAFVNKVAKPDYRVSLDAVDVMINNFSNHFSEGPADMHIRGRFMGSGETTVSATFRPEKKGPDFTMRIAVQETNMTAMNDIFRAYGKFDVSAGLFSVYSELGAKDRKVTGYVKPLFKDIKVYDKRSDKEKRGFKKLYEKIIGGAVKLLENIPRDEVATETPIQGSIENPNASTWEIIVNLIQNAFFQAILPGFERSVGK